MMRSRSIGNLPVDQAKSSIAFDDDGPVVVMTVMTHIDMRALVRTMMHGAVAMARADVDADFSGECGRRDGQGRGGHDGIAKRFHEILLLVGAAA